MGLFEILRISDVSGQVQASRTQLDRLEAKLDLLLEHFQITYVPAGVVGLLEEGKWTEAVKAYRRATGVGRREAKEAVEALAAGSGGEDH